MNSSISTQPEKPWDSAAHGFTTLGGCKSHRCFPQWWHVCVSAGAEGEQPNGHVNNTTEVRVFLRRNYTNVLNPLQLSVSVSPSVSLAFCLTATLWVCIHYVYCCQAMRERWNEAISCSSSSDKLLFILFLLSPALLWCFSHSDLHTERRGGVERKRRMRKNENVNSWDGGNQVWEGNLGQKSWNGGTWGWRTWRWIKV